MRSGGKLATDYFPENQLTKLTHFAVHTITEAKQRAGRSQGGGSSSQVN